MSTETATLTPTPTASFDLASDASVPATYSLIVKNDRDWTEITDLPVDTDLDVFRYAADVRRIRRQVLVMKDDKLSVWFTPSRNGGPGSIYFASGPVEMPDVPKVASSYPADKVFR